MHRQITELENGYAWGDLKDKKLVDIGGGSGHVSIALARVSNALLCIYAFIFSTILNGLITEN